MDIRDATPTMKQFQWMWTLQYLPESTVLTPMKTKIAIWSKDFASSVERKDIKHINVLIKRNNPSSQLSILRRELSLPVPVNSHLSNAPIHRSAPKASGSLISLRDILI